MAELAPHLMKYDYIEGSLFGQLALSPSKEKQVKQSLIVDSIDVKDLSRISIRRMRSAEIV